LDIERRGHFVAIAGLKSAGIEVYAAGHFRIDNAKAFLLGVVDEIGAEDFEIVNIDQVLVIVAPTDRILGRELVVGAYEDLQQALDAACRGGDVDGISGVDLDEAGLMVLLLVRHDYLLQDMRPPFHSDDDLFVFMFIQQEIALFRLIAGK
jgi:hypothetical protein